MENYNCVKKPKILEYEEFSPTLSSQTHESMSSCRDFGQEEVIDLNQPAVANIRPKYGSLDNSDTLIDSDTISEATEIGEPANEHELTQIRNEMSLSMVESLSKHSLVDSVLNSTLSSVTLKNENNSQNCSSSNSNSIHFTNNFNNTSTDTCKNKVLPKTLSLKDNHKVAIKGETSHKFVNSISAAAVNTAAKNYQKNNKDNSYYGQHHNHNSLNQKTLKVYQCSICKFNICSRCIDNHKRFENKIKKSIARCERDNLKQSTADRATSQQKHQALERSKSELSLIFLLNLDITQLPKHKLVICKTCYERSELERLKKASFLISKSLESGIYNNCLDGSHSYNSNLSSNSLRISWNVCHYLTRLTEAT